MATVLDFISTWQAALLLILITYLLSQRKPKRFPPGPWGFPILGHLPLLGIEPYKTAAAWKPKYGPILGIDFASFPCVIITDYKLAKEAFADPVFSGRPDIKFCSMRCGGIRPEGIIFADGRTWREQRSFTHRRLKEIGGFGTKSMESITVEQMEEFMRLLRDKVDRPITTKALFNVAVVNALWAIIAGKPFDQTDPEVLRAAHTVVDGFAESSLWSMLAMFMPWLNDHFPDWVTGKKGVEKQYKPVVEFLQPYIEQHWKTHKPDQPRDFIDAFIDEVKQTTDPESSFHITRSKHSLETTLLDLFLAGTETASITLSWVCLFMARYLAIQDKVVEEVKRVIGTRRSPTLADRKHMPYTEAVIHEVMRMRPLVPLGVFHSTTEAVHFHGFDIPKDTMVFMNIYGIHYDREFWGDPEEFRPERWLSADGTEFERKDAFVVFSSGKRVCLGEQLGRDEVFLFTAGLFQKFRINVDPNRPPPTLEPSVGGTTLGPKDHQIIFILQKD